jgi:hypothetical protein
VFCASKSVTRFFFRTLLELQYSNTISLIQQRLDFELLQIPQHNARRILFCFFFYLVVICILFCVAIVAH